MANDYEHFGGKEGLYAVVVDREITTISAAISSAIADPAADAAAARADQDTHDQKEAAKLEIEKMKESARAHMELEREEAAKEMKGQMVTIALTAAAKLMGRKMDEAADEELVTEFINGLDQNKTGELSC